MTFIGKFSLPVKKIKIWLFLANFRKILKILGKFQNIFGCDVFGRSPEFSCVFERFRAFSTFGED